MIELARRLIAAAAMAACLWACAPPVTAPSQDAGPTPADFPAALYQRLHAQGKQVYRIDAASSRVVIEVRRAGSLARLGHDHVVASHDLAGYIAPEQGRADLWLPLDLLVVDEPALRAQAGFDTQPSAGDIEGTRSNMLTRVLRTAQHPFALIAVSAAAGSAEAQTVAVAVTLRGVTVSLDTPVRIERTADSIGISGKLALEQSRFGIVPFSILGGALQVRDGIDLRFELRARRML